MAKAQGTIASLSYTSNLLGAFSKSCQHWTVLSDHLFDITQHLNAAALSLEGWQRKYDVQDRRPIVYLEVLFGRPGAEHIQGTLDSISIVAKGVREDVDRILRRALKPKSSEAPWEDPVLRYNEELLQDCLHIIRKSKTRSRNFITSTFVGADDLELRLDRLHRKLGLLERRSDFYLEREHPDIFHSIRRLPGRRVILKVGHPKWDAIQKDLLDAHAARKDAELLHRACGRDSKAHIGLSVPQIHRRDFAFLLEHHGHMQEVLVSPITIKAIHDRSRVQTTMPTAISSLVRNTRDPCYLLPSSASSGAGFRLSFPPSNLLSDLEYKDSLSTIIRSPRASLSQQILYPRDQCALACGIASGSFRLVGSRWAHSIDCRNIRWRRGTEDRWTSMLAAEKGDGPAARTLEHCLAANMQRRDHRDLSKHVHIFRIGLVLTEVALKVPIAYMDFDVASSTVRIHLSLPSRRRCQQDNVVEMDAAEIAAEVEARTNVLMANMCFFCLNVLQDRDAMADADIEAKFHKDVLGEVKVLDGLVKGGRQRGGESGIGTPRSGRSSVVF